VKAFIAPPSADGGKKMFLCAYLLSAGRTLAKTKVLASNLMTQVKVTNASALPDLKASIAKSTLTSANQAHARMDPSASMALMITPANAPLDMTERIAKTTLMNVLRSLALTGQHARTLSMPIPANAFLDLKELTVKSTSMSVSLMELY
jgi:hypothetical protein